MSGIALATGDWACRIYNMDQCITAHTRNTLGLGILIAGGLFATVAVLIGFIVRG